MKEILIDVVKPNWLTRILSFLLFLFKCCDYIASEFLSCLRNTNMSFAPELRTHAQKVCNLYKRAMRQIESYYGQRTLVRYHQVILRSRFDQNRCVNDPKDQRRLYWVGENELFETKHPAPIAKLPRSIGIAGGVAAERVVEPPDWVLDYWHPLEKAQYPEYFKTREVRKAEYICKWYNGELM